MPTDTLSVELLPQGAFLVTTADGQKHKGRFSMYMLNLFGKKKECEGYFSVIQKLTIGMSIEDYADLFLLAFQDYFREAPEQCSWTQTKVMDDLLDAMGGTASQQFLNLVKHAIGRLTTFKEKEGINGAQQPEGEDPEKKSQ